MHWINLVRAAGPAMGHRGAARERQGKRDYYGILVSRVGR